MIYTVNNIIDWIINNPKQVIVDINMAVNCPQIPVHGLGPTYNLVGVSEELAYWSSLNAFLIGLWGVVKFSTERTQKDRMAIRDFIYEMAQASRHNYEATSRVLRSYEILTEETRMEKRGQF